MSHTYEALKTETAMAGLLPQGVDGTGVAETALRAGITAHPPQGSFPFNGVDDRAAEQYKIVRTKIAHHQLQPHVIAVTSAGIADGKSVTAMNIAAALSLKRDTSVLLIDADFRRSKLARVLDISPPRGLRDVLAGSCAIDTALVSFEGFPNLFLLPAGETTNAAPELLDSTAWKTVCDALRRKFRYVILDTPPVGVVADYDLIQLVADGIIVVIRPDHTERAACFRAIEAVPRQKMIGVVMNCVPEWPGMRKGYDHYKYYVQTAASERARSGDTK